MDRLLTPQEAADYLGIDIKKFESLVKENKIPHYKIAGKFIRFSEQELSKFKAKLLRGKLERTEATEREGPTGSKPSIDKLDYKTRIVEFLKFNDFYILSSIIIIILLYYIFVK